MNNNKQMAMYIAENGNINGLSISCDGLSNLSAGFGYDSTSSGTFFVNSSDNSAVTTTLLYTPWNGSCWDYWQNHHYPYIIKESYPVYIQERAQDKGKQAFEIIKSLQDKKLLNLEKVKDFIDAMDLLIKIL